MALLIFIQNDQSRVFVMKKMDLAKCITITFSDVAENGPGMEKIGEDQMGKFTFKYLKDMADMYINAEFIDLTLNGVQACVVVLRNYLRSHEKLFSSLHKLDWDKKALMRGSVKNKLARHNLCFADFSQEPNYDLGKGRVYDFQDLRRLQSLRQSIMSLTEIDNLIAEGNLYYDVSKCGIGYHGDGERTTVIGIRLGHKMDLCYRWYLRSDPISKKVTIELNPGDLYIMSDKAVGTDWKKRSIQTLRHSAGCEKYTC